MPNVFLGVGEDEIESQQHFDSILDEFYEEVANDNVAGYKNGRPATGYVEFNTDIRSASNGGITALSDKLGISIGDAVDYLLLFYEKRSGGAKCTEETDRDRFNSKET